MRYREVLAECAQQRSGQRQNISMQCAKEIAGYFHDGSTPALAFASTGTITLPYEELWAHFFPKEPRPDAEWTVALAFYQYLYSRRKRTEGPVTWTLQPHGSTRG